jgi:WD40 repeat protein
MKKVFALFGHNRPVRMIKFNREGDIVVTCGDDGAVCMWSSNNAKLLAQFQSKDAVPAFDIDYDTKTIITAQVTAGVVMYDCENVKYLSSNSSLTNRAVKLEGFHSMDGQDIANLLMVIKRF